MPRLTRERLFGWAWLALAVALALHVADEASHDFLGLWNPLARAARERLGLPFPPVFSFGVWLGGLIAGVLLLLSCTPRAFAGARWLAWVAVPLGVIMLANGAGHLVGSLVVGRALPGVLSAPLLLACSVLLLLAAAGVLRQATSPTSS